VVYVVLVERSNGVKLGSAGLRKPKIRGLAVFSFSLKARFNSSLAA
jgi:hypothetical protein